MKKRIGMLIHTNQVLTSFGSLINELKKNNFLVYFFVNADPSIKPDINPCLHPQHIKKFPYDRLLWYKDNKELAKQIEDNDVSAILTVELQPLLHAPEFFKNRTYKIYNFVHNVNNWHTKGVELGILDKTFVGYEKYGEYFGWDKKDYLALGLPRFDGIVNFSKEEIQRKYDLPKKFILIFAPNNNQLNWYMVYRVAQEVKRSGYEVVIKGKYPKCAKFVYHFLANKYFLNDISFYPFISYELVYASDGVIGFDTTAVEEVLMCSRSMVNFSIKSYRDREEKDGLFKPLKALWNSDFCLDIPLKGYNFFGIFKKLPKFMNFFSKKINYKKIQTELVTRPGGASERVVEWLSQEV
ncbi:MAG: hypothetical protein WCW16_03805 [Candidatus Magasanikbacteria bacterium]